NRELPLWPLRVTSFVTIVSNDLYKLKYRRGQKMFIHFIHMRLFTQGLVIEALILGFLYSAGKNYIRPRFFNVTKK
ncbi:hypothetical protein DBR06_SOUSAS2510072, partial [Sousa chinensis]